MVGGRPKPRRGAGKPREAATVPRPGVTDPGHVRTPEARRAAAEVATVAERAARSRVRTPVQQVTGSG